MLNQIIGGLVLLVVGHIIANLIREGYLKRQMEDVESRLQKGFEYHKIHFAHAERSDIHQKSMDEQLINAKFDNTNQKIESLGLVVGTKIDNLSQRIIELADIVQAKNP